LRRPDRRHPDPRLTRTPPSRRVRRLRNEALRPGTRRNQGHKILKDWLKERYHAPSDDLNQPIEVEAAASFVRLLGQFAATVANPPERPQWKPDSFFRRFATAAR